MIVEVALFCSHGPQVSINVRHWKVGTVAGGAVTDLNTALAIAAIYGPLYKAVLCDTARYEGLRLQIIKPTRLAEVTTADEEGTGEVTGDALPYQVASLIALKTAFAGRRNKGRWYVPFASESVNNNEGHPQIDYLGDVAALGDAYTIQLVVVAGGATALLDPVIYHRATGTSTLVTGYAVRREWATQRRRSQINSGDVLPVL